MGKKTKAAVKAELTLETTGVKVPPSIPVDADGALETASQPIRRDHWGRPYIQPPDGPSTAKQVAYTRVTTFIDCLGDKSALEKWKVRTAVYGAAIEAADKARTGEVSILDEATMAGGLWQGGGDERVFKDAMNALSDRALEYGSEKAKATIGTNLHALTEIVDRGLDLPGGLLDEDYLDIEAYSAETRRVGFEAERIEQFVVHDGMKTAGTLDRVVRYRGKKYIADVKTGAIAYDPGKIAMQLALYARSLEYNHRTGARSVLSGGGVSREVGFVIHLPQGESTCRIYPLDLVAGWRGVKLARDVRAWRRDSKTSIGKDHL